MMFPSAIALLNGHGSINCVHNMKKPVYAPIQLTEKIEIYSLPALSAMYGKAEILTKYGPELGDTIKEIPYLPAFKEKVPGRVKYL
jgi:hypothetical protein